MKRSILKHLYLAATFSFLAFNLASAGVLEVGPGRKFKGLEAANKAAKPGDTILVYPRKKGAAYEKVAINVTKPRLTFVAARKKKSPRVLLSGQGFEYSGRGNVPRGIFQFQKGSDGGTVRGFILTEAHNKSHNGAGVRINQANNITVTDCEIHHNDMGVQSNGDGTLKAGMHQLISHCKVHHNGNKKDPGYNHNFYLGGTSAVIRFCEVFKPLTGHNVKSRAHFNLIEYNFIHDSLNREFDLVDGKETGLPNSHSILRGNVIVKAQPAKGNKTVIHFGQDGGKDHNGTIYLIHNTILSPYLSPIVELSAKNAKAVLYNNIFDSAGTKQRKQVLLNARKGASLKDCKVAYNWLGTPFKSAKTEYGTAGNGYYKARPLYRNPKKGDYRLAKAFKGIVNAGLPHKKIPLPTLPGAKKEKNILGFSYKAELEKVKRKIKGRPDIGAYEYGT